MIIVFIMCCVVRDINNMIFMFLVLYIDCFFSYVLCYIVIDDCCCMMIVYVKCCMGIV